MLWAQHHAWLTAPRERQAPKGGGEAPPATSRATEWEIDLASAAMPPLVGGDWLLNWLFEAGPLASDGMGARGLSWPELAAWEACTRPLATPWELAVVHRLSASYANAWHAATKPDCKAYWLNEELAQANAARSDAVGQQLKSVLSALAKRGTPKPNPPA